MATPSDRKRALFDMGSDCESSVSSGEEDREGLKKDAEEGKKFRRPRNHVNPFSTYHQRLLDLPEDWPSAHYDDPSLPFWIDIGCAYGHFCMAMARKHPNFNFLGIEIRTSITDRANAICAKEGGLRNLFFLGCNANVNLRGLLLRICAYSPTKAVKLPASLRANPRLWHIANDQFFSEENTRNDKSSKSSIWSPPKDRMLQGVPSGVHMVSIQFPDPHFKKRNHKRRVVQMDLVEAIVNFVVPGGSVFLQSDIFEVVKEMRTLFSEHSSLVDPREENDWMTNEAENPTDVPTEREKGRLVLGEPVYRSLLWKIPSTTTSALLK